MTTRIPKVGDTVASRKWGPIIKGEVTKVDTKSGTVFIAWYGTVVEDEINLDDVEIID